MLGRKAFRRSFIFRSTDALPVGRGLTGDDARYFFRKLTFRAA